MKYSTILIDADDATLVHTTNIFKRLPDLNLVSSYREVKSALGQGTVFNPNLFLVDVDDADNRKSLPEFVEIFPEAIVVGIMSKWDADKAFESIRGGAIGCLLKPFSSEDIIDGIKIFSRGVRHTNPRSFSFFSAKGRSGKTTLIANLALSIVRQTSDMVAIIDADLQFSDMAIFFDVEPMMTVVEATRDIKFLSPIRLNAYFLPVAENIQLLCGPKRLEYSELVDVESLTAVVRMAQTLFHYVLIDLPSGVSAFSTNMCELAAVLPNEFLMVSAANSGKLKNVMNYDNLLAKKIDVLAGEIINAH